MEVAAIPLANNPKFFIQPLLSVINEGCELDFIDHIHDLSARIEKQASVIQTEEATKNAFVMPFISALGYNVFDPTEVTPELVADVGTKKGEKVDYAILIDGKPIILFECKWCGTNLDKEDAPQLYRYFSVTEARFGVLTNGIIYRFYSDLENPNVMDAKPFLELNMLDIKEPVVEEIKKFSKSAFDLNSIYDTARELKYMREIRKLIDEQTNDPSEEFVKFFASKVYSGKLTQSVRDQFTQITKKTFKQFINDKINDRLNIALVSEAVQTPQGKQPETDTPVIVEEEDIQPTEEELNGYYLIKSLLRTIIDPKRINFRKSVNYCGVMLDDSNRKRIARMYLDPGRMYIGIFDEQKHETMSSLETIDDIYKYEDKLKAVVSYYDAQKPKDQTGKSLSSFTFKGKKYATKYWKDLLLQICRIMAELHKDRFDDILTLSGPKRPYFSKNPNDLKYPNQIEGTDVFAEVNFNSDGMLKLSIDVISKFGYLESDLSVETQ
ncbi:Uncharacterised protein [uncultured archaeon]|nr:Uncharacterised protein [uncultured archaeon]